MILDVSVQLNAQQSISKQYLFYVLLCQKGNQYQQIYPNSGCILKNVIFNDDENVFLHIVAAKPNDIEPVANHKIISKQITGQNNELCQYVDISGVQNEIQQIQINFLNEIIYISVEKLKSPIKNVTIDQVSQISDNYPCNFTETLFYRICTEYKAHESNTSQIITKNKQQLTVLDDEIREKGFSWLNLCKSLFKGIVLDLQQQQPLNVYIQSIMQAIIKLRDEAEPGECELRRMARIIIGYQVYGDDQPQEVTNINILICTNSLQYKIAQECAIRYQNMINVPYYIDKDVLPSLFDLYQMLQNYQLLIELKSPIQIIIFQSSSSDQITVNQSIIDSIRQNNDQSINRSSNMLSKDQNIQDLMRLIDVSNKFQSQIDQKIKKCAYPSLQFLFIPYIDVQLQDIQKIKDFSYDIANEFYAIQKNQIFSRLIWEYQNYKSKTILQQIIDSIILFTNGQQHKDKQKCFKILHFNQEIFWQQHCLYLDSKKVKITQLVNMKKPKDPKEVILYSVTRIQIINIYHKIIFICSGKEKYENTQLNNVICMQNQANLTFKQLTALQERWKVSTQESNEFRIKIYSDSNQLNIRESFTRQRQSKDVIHFVWLTEADIKYRIMEGDYGDCTEAHYQ